MKCSVKLVCCVYKSLYLGGNLYDLAFLKLKYIEIDENELDQTLVILLVNRTILVVQ